jgi:hypothetical protein
MEVKQVEEKEKC